MRFPGFDPVFIESGGDNLSATFSRDLTSMSNVDLNPIWAGVAETPKLSDFTSSQERIVAYARQQKANRAKQGSKHQSPKQQPFKWAQRHDWTKEIDRELDYLRLVVWTGRAIREDEKGAIPQ